MSDIEIEYVLVLILVRYCS